MANTVSGYNGSKPAGNGARQWFAVFALALIVWAGLYIFCHSFMNISGYKIARFTPADIRHINSILINGNINNQPAQEYTPPAKPKITNSNDGFLDTPADSATQPVAQEYKSIASVQFFTEEEIKKKRAKLAMTYISTQYGTDVSVAELLNIEKYMSTFSPRETGIFLTDYRLRLFSYFWFSGVLAYVEVIFWVVFGVLCSLLFYTGTAFRKGNGFNSRDVWYQCTRLFYGPFVAVLLLLGFTYLKGNATMNAESGEGVLILAFMLGSVSGIVLDILDRLRNSRGAVVIQHAEYRQDAPQRMQDSTYRQAARREAEPATKTTYYTPAPQQDSEDDYLEALRSQQPIEKTQDNRRTPEDNEIPEVAIDLKLDFSGLFDEERLQLQRVGFSKAIVTLHNVNGKDIIPARKQKNDMTVFVASDVKPGIYIARATLSQRLRDDQIINLFGEKTAYITEDKPGLELFVKKYEAAD